LIFLPFRFRAYSFNCYFFNQSLNWIIFSITSLNILYHSINWIILLIASFNILVHFILCQIWSYSFNWICFVFNPFFIKTIFSISSLNILFTKILLTFRVMSLKDWTGFSFSFLLSSLPSVSEPSLAYFQNIPSICFLLILIAILFIAIFYFK